MKKHLLLAGLLLISAPAQAAGMMDWLASSTKNNKAEQPADSAELVTLEPDENEMYPKASTDGKHLAVSVEANKKQHWASLRAAENGDPLNTITEEAMGPVSWHQGKIDFLSMKTGRPGLWEKAADGAGVVRRIMELPAHLVSAQRLPDDSLIGVRIDHAKEAGKNIKTKRFAEWLGYMGHSTLVRISPTGSPQELGKGFHPAVSPDGQWIVFSMPIGRSVHLFMMRTNGDELIQLTDSRSMDVQPAWSPNGQWIVFTSNQGDADMRNPQKSNWDLWAINREGRNLTRLTQDEADDGAASVARNGIVYFHSNRKVSKDQAQARQVKGSTAGFHIWKVTLPGTPTTAAH